MNAEATSLDLTPPAAEKPRKPRQKLSAIYPEDATITVLAEGNPKKVGSRAHAVFEAYSTSKTVGDFFVATKDAVGKNGKRVPGSYADITYDVDHGYIRVG